MWPWEVAKYLREIGLIGINQRNAEYISRYNERRFYPRVDDKLITKNLAIAAGMPVPELYAVVEMEHDIEPVHELLKDREQFVCKPSRGSGGDGIVVITGRRGDKYRKASGQLMSRDELSHQLSNTLSGLFSLGGQTDKVLFEYCVQFDPLFENVSFRGVPDIRIIAFLGYPVMAMIRLPTMKSDGKANLHQGAIGVGIDIPTGITRRGVWGNEPVNEHPDTNNTIVGLQIPNWDDLLMIASNCYELSSLGYVGVDIVLDKDQGSLILELNARPGLNIQIANGNGLKHRLAKVEALAVKSKDPRERIEFSKSNFPTL